MVVPVSALLTGQPSLAASAALTKSSLLMPSTTPRTVSLMPVMPVPGVNSTSALVSSDVGAEPAWASPLERAIEKHEECAAAISSSGLVLPLASSARLGQDTSYVPMPEDSRDTLPAPSNGGFETFRTIVAKFYEGVAEDELLRPLYPEEDLGPAEERFLLFLVQYWGGPTTYSENRGHPRLRMRHAPFAVTPEAKEHWLTHFRAGLDAVDLTPEQDARFWDYVTHAAQFMVNTFE